MTPPPLTPLRMPLASTVATPVALEVHALVYPGIKPEPDSVTVAYEHMLVGAPVIEEITVVAILVAMHPFLV